MRYLTFLIAIFCWIELFSQPLDPNKIQYYDYSTIIKDLKLNSVKSMYYSDLDYESMLYLDKSSVKTLLQINPKFLLEKNIDTAVIFQRSKDQFVQQFDLVTKDLRDFFENKSVLNHALDKMIGDKNRQLDNKIYIKDNNVAIYTVFGQSWSATYKARLIDNKVKIELLYEIIE